MIYIWTPHPISELGLQAAIPKAILLGSPFRAPEGAVVLLDDAALRRLEALRDHCASRVVMVWYEEISIGVAIELLSAGIRGLVSKKRPAGELAEIIRTVEAGGRYVDPDLLSELQTSPPIP